MKVLATLFLICSYPAYSQVLLPYPLQGTCRPEKKAIVCTESHKNLILVAVVQPTTGWDSLANYREYLSQPKEIRDREGRTVKSQIISAHNENWQNLLWIYSIHKNSELFGFSTAYVATIAELGSKQFAVLLTLTAEHAIFEREEKEFRRTLTSVTREQLLACAQAIEAAQNVASVRPFFQRLLSTGSLPKIDGGRNDREMQCFHHHPIKPLPEQHACALSLLDRYFDRIVDQYPTIFKSLLRAGYYQGRYVESVQSLLESEHVWGSVHILRMQMLDESGKDSLPLFRIGAQNYLPAVRIDGELTPLIKRLVLVHEIGIHLGQILAMDMVEENYRGNEAAWAAFTELSAWSVTKDLYDLIPLKLIEYDFSLKPIFQSTRNRAKAQMLDLWGLPKQGLGWLMVGAYEGLDLSLEEATAFETKYKSIP